MAFSRFSLGLLVRPWLPMALGVAVGWGTHSFTVGVVTTIVLLVALWFLRRLLRRECPTVVGFLIVTLFLSVAIQVGLLRGNWWRRRGRVIVPQSDQAAVATYLSTVSNGEVTLATLRND